MRLLGQYRLRRRCEAALAGIDVPSPWDLRVFLDRLSLRRGRPILLDEAPALATVGVSAQWWKQPEADVILYAPTVSVFYLELSVFHEVGHMLCGHDRTAGDGPLPGGDLEALAAAPGAVRTIFSRSSRFDRREEQEAELVAYRLKLLAEQARVATAGPPAAPPPGSWDPAAAHLREAMRKTLGGRRRA